MQEEAESFQADRQIASTTLRVESKVFFLDLKENSRGQYVKISERGANRERSTIVIPATGVKWFQALLTYYIKGSAADQGKLIAKQLVIETKAFFFEAGENPRGKFLRISESGSGTRGRSSLIVPSGGTNCSAWENLRDNLDKMEAYYLREQSYRAEEHQLPPVLDDRAPSLYPAVDSLPVVEVAGSQQLVGPGPSPPSIGETKAGGQVLRAGHKRFFFDLGSNQKGDFLRITEAVGNERMSIIVPGSALEQFSTVVQNAAAQHRNANP